MSGKLLAPGLAMPSRSGGIARRSLLSASACLAIGGALSQPAHGAETETIEITPSLIAAAKREDSFVLRYSSPVDEMTAMAGAFKDQFGIKVLLDRKVGLLGSQQFATEERAGQHVMDVNFSADPEGIIALAREGFYLPFTFPDIDAKLDPSNRLQNLGYSSRSTDITIAYNSSLLPHARARELFKTWHGLLDPSLKGKIGVTEPGGGGIPFVTYLMFYRRPEYGRDFLSKLAAQKPRLYGGSAPGREDLNSGAISVFIPSWESVGMAEFMKGDKTAWTYPELVPSYANAYFCISRNAPHGNAARLFVAWVFSPDGAKALEATQLKPTLKGVPDNRSAVAKLKQTDWWQPVPEKARWSPDLSDWPGSYNKLLPDMRAVLGWQQ